GVSVGVYFLGKIFGNWANRTSLGLFNRIGGLLLSFCKVLAVLSILIYFWNKIDPREEILKPSVRDASLSFRYVESATYRFWPIVSETVQTGMDCIKGLKDE
ncbi:MAG: CvpA family protein, partial [Bacteroidales bacterium]|nr:CvpA family protein [Bacteroidales bacterium]